MSASDHRAIILAAGVGKRFGGELADLPKGLLEVDGESLIARLLRQLRATGIVRSTVVIGHAGDRIEESLERSGDARGVEFVRNPDYRRGAILSVWCARERLSGPALVMDADVWGPDAMLSRLVQSPHASCSGQCPNSIITSPRAGDACSTSHDGRAASGTCSASRSAF